MARQREVTGHEQRSLESVSGIVAAGARGARRTNVNGVTLLGKGTSVIVLNATEPRSIVGTPQYPCSSAARFNLSW